MEQKERGKVGNETVMSCSTRTLIGEESVKKGSKELN